MIESQTLPQLLYDLGQTLLVDHVIFRLLKSKDFVFDTPHLIYEVSLRRDIKSKLHVFLDLIGLLIEMRLFRFTNNA